MTTSVIRTLIVDDEPVARQTIRLLLHHDTEIAIVGECSNGPDAIQAIRAESPDLLFLDVQMPGMNGFEMLRTLRADIIPVVVFTTAYDQYAIQAFEVHALDYLLKPFDDDRFRDALNHVKAVIAGERVEEISRQLLDLLDRFDLRDKLPSHRQSFPNEYLSRFMIKSAGRVSVVDVDEVQWIEAEGNYVNLYSNGKRFLLREKIGTLEHQLDPSQFSRIHRSTIVRTANIKSMKPLFNGDHIVTMSDGKELTLSRTYRERVLAALGGVTRQ
jgi:two-component system, LytTR family, response regulator